jgi:hypothetical protein
MGTGRILVLKRQDAKTAKSTCSGFRANVALPSTALPLAEIPALNELEI